MNEMMELYLNYLDDVRGVSEKTLEAYAQDLAKLHQFCVENEIDTEKMSNEQARRFIAKLMKAGYRPNSVNRILSGVKGFFSYCVKFDYCAADPFSRINNLSGGRRLPAVLTREEVQRMIAAAGNDFSGIRDRLIFEMLYSTGCRLSELTGMNLKDLNLSENSVLVHGKGGKDRFVFITPSAHEILDVYLPLRGRRQETRPVSQEDRQALLINNRGRRMSSQGVHYIFNKYTAELGIPKHITPHTFRHTFATHIMENDAGIRVVQELLGHEHISTTQIYSHVSSKRLKEVYRKSHPHG